MRESALEAYKSLSYHTAEKAEKVCFLPSRLGTRLAERPENKQI